MLIHKRMERMGLVDLALPSSSVSGCWEKNGSNRKLFFFSGTCLSPVRSHSYPPERIQRIKSTLKGMKIASLSFLSFFKSVCHWGRALSFFNVRSPAVIPADVEVGAKLGQIKIFTESGVTTRDLIGWINALPQKMGDKQQKRCTRSTGSASRHLHFPLCQPPTLALLGRTRGARGDLLIPLVNEQQSPNK